MNVDTSKKEDTSDTVRRVNMFNVTGDDINLVYT